MKKEVLNIEDDNIPLLTKSENLGNFTEAQPDKTEEAIKILTKTLSN